MSYHARVNAFKKALLSASLREANGCRSVAAERLGLSRTYFVRLLVRHGVRRPLPKIGGPGQKIAARLRAS